MYPVFLSLLLLLAAACTNRPLARDGGGAPVSKRRTGKARKPGDAFRRATGTSCDWAASLVKPSEVARDCRQSVSRLQAAGHECAYRIGTAPQAMVRFSFAGRGGVSYETLLRKHGREKGRPAPPLGPKGRFFIDRKRGRTSVLFEVMGQAIEIASASPYCDPGPLIRLARRAYSRARGRN